MKLRHIPERGRAGMSISDLLSICRIQLRCDGWKKITHFTQFCYYNMSNNIFVVEHRRQQATPARAVSAVVVPSG